MNIRPLLIQSQRQKIKLSQRWSQLIRPNQSQSQSRKSPIAALRNMVYVPGFGWIEGQGPNQATYAEDMYENGNKIGIMG